MFKPDNLEGQHLLHLTKLQGQALYVEENNQYRWLRINDTLQTVMDVRQPHNLVLPHLSAMLMALYYRPSPSTAVELGLGGGALQRFFQHYFPKLQFTSIELSSEVIACFQTYFNPGTLPASIVQQDAGLAVKQLAGLDILFVDLFSANASPVFLQEPDFYRDCFRCLSEDGILVANLIHPLESQNDWVIKCVTDLSENPPRLFGIPGFRNKVLLASKSGLSKVEYDQKLMRMCKHYGLQLNSIIELL